MIRSTAPLVGLLLAACGDAAPLSAAAPHPTIDRSAAMDPLPEYRAWYDEQAECTGGAKPFEDLRWRVVPEVVTGDTWGRFDNAGNLVYGVYFRSISTVVLAERAIANAPVVRHEVTHAQLPVGVLHGPEFAACAEVKLPLIPRGRR